MTDVFTKEKRSEIMSKIRSKSGLDRKIHYWLCAKHIRHEMHPKVRGNPDIRLKDTEVYVFLDSCFWHGCPLHFREPKSSFTGVDWIQKIQRNKRRDMERVNLPYRWIAIWEHSIRNGEFKKVLEYFSTPQNRKNRG